MARKVDPYKEIDSLLEELVSGGFRSPTSVCDLPKAGDVLTCMDPKVSIPIRLEGKRKYAPIKWNETQSRWYVVELGCSISGCPHVYLPPDAEGGYGQVEITYSQAGPLRGKFAGEKRRKKHATIV